MADVATLIRAGKIDQAEAALKSVNSDTADYCYHRGLLLQAQGDLESALDSLENAVDKDQNHRDACFTLACWMDQFGDEERAMELYEHLAQQAPCPVNVLLNLAVMYEDRGMYELALECVDRVVTEHPNHRRALMFQKDIESSLNMHYDENQERNREKRNAIMDTPISDFELSVRSRNCLKKMNINSLGDLLRISEAELLSYKNFGETSLNEIKAMLKQKGLRIGQLKEEQLQTPRSGGAPTRQSGSDGQGDLLNRFIADVELSGRSRKCLQRLNVVTLADLVAKTEAELLASKNFGQTSLNEIKAKLTELGLSLRKKVD